MKARIENNVAVDVHATPETAFHPDIAAQFVDVPDDVKRGWTQDGAGDWAAPEVPVAEGPEAESPTFRTTVSRVEFKTLFTIEEHVKIKMARDYQGEDTAKLTLKYTLDAAYDILDDPQLGHIHLTSDTITQLLGALATAEIIAPERVAEIQKGVEV